ncbi:SDR family oxidoreductase [uncultured Pelagimonas sp.]|uniref:SDR family oxidoreductase n=1 Tax=uncultured Pelagimonas sp. TaxID=1618102 RepID=UPI002638ECFE|nr:SDR family oxidoreductase [uncultured Pelagimonas sp.]
MAKRVFITGGAGGLGRALATQLVQSGAKVLIGDIDDTAAQATAAEIGAIAIRCDVTSEGDFATVANWLQDNWGGVDLVINNAGVAQMGALDQTPIDDWHWILNINTLGPVRAAQALGPLMPPGSQMLNIASMAAMLYLPNSAAYNASKSALLAISETLMLEWEPRGITIHVACPSFFRTDLARNMRAADDTTRAATTRMVERARVGADEVATTIFVGLAAGDPHILTHRSARKSWLLKRYLPFSMYMSMMRKELAKLNTRLKTPSKTKS